MIPLSSTNVLLYIPNFALPNHSSLLSSYFLLLLLYLSYLSRRWVCCGSLSFPGGVSILLVGLAATVNTARVLGLCGRGGEGQERKGRREGGRVSEGDEDLFHRVAKKTRRGRQGGKET